MFFPQVIFLLNLIKYIEIILICIALKNFILKFYFITNQIIVIISICVRASLDCGIFFHFLRFSCKNKLIPLKFLYNSFKISAFK